VEYLMILPASHIAVVFFLAVYVKIRKYEYEHAVTRLMISALYVFIAFDKDMTEAMRQFLVRWFLLLLGSVEIISYFVRLLVIRGRS